MSTAQHASVPRITLHLGNHVDQSILHKITEHNLKSRVSSHPYAQQIATARKTLERLSKEGLTDGWELVSENDDVAVWKKDSGEPLWMTRGETIVTGLVPELVFATVMTFGARAGWDDFYETGRLVKYIDRETSLGYASMKGRWPVASRDTSVVSGISRRPDGSILQVTTSVENPEVPDVSGKVRASLDIAGWSLIPVMSQGKPSTKLTYFTKVDLKGNLPTAALKLIATQTPLCVGRIRDFSLKQGTPPFYTSLGGELEMAAEFDKDSSSYEIKFKHVEDYMEKLTEFYVPKQRYPNGFAVTFPSNVFESQILESSAFGLSGWHIRLVAKPQTKSQSIVLTIKKVEGAKKITSNGASVSPVPFDQRDKTSEMSAEAPKEEVAKPADEKEEEDADEAATEEQPSLPLPKGPSLNLSSQVSDSHRFVKDVKEIYEFSEKCLNTPSSDGFTDFPNVLSPDRLQFKDISGHPMGLLRGDTVVKGYSPDAVFATIRENTCRQLWDKDLFDFQEVRETIDANTFLFYVRTKRQFPTSPRDLALLCVWRKEADGTIFYTGKSVIEKTLLPEVKDCVRGDNELALWVLKPFQDGNQISTKLTVMAMNNPNGWIPGTVLQLVKKEIPKAVKHVRVFMETYGPPPVPVYVPGTVLGSEFNNETSAFTLRYNHEPSDLYPYLIVQLSKKRYPSGATVTVTPSGSYTATLSGNHEVSMHPTAEAKVGQTITVVIARNTSGAEKIAFNGTELKGQVVAKLPRKSKAGSKGSDQPQSASQELQQQQQPNEEILQNISDATSRLQEVQSQLEAINKSILALEKRQKGSRRTVVEKLILLLTFVIGLWLLWKSRR